jgi:hypothetical protein
LACCIANCAVARIGALGVVFVLLRVCGMCDMGGMGNKDDKPAGAAALYTGPMHPNVTSDKADAKCPKCGMQLVSKK